MQMVAVGIGAALGAWMRWGLGLWLDSAAAVFPMGTLAANLIGGGLIGFGLGYFGATPGLDPAVRLFCVTGFLGGLTTFSSFSAESFQLFAQGHAGWALAHAAVHVLGSLAACALGVLAYRMLAS